VEVLPQYTNHVLSFPGRQVRLGFRKPVLSTCRDEVLAALTTLSAESGKEAFTVREVFDKMAEVGSTYAVGTVFKTMQRMKEPPTRRASLIKWAFHHSPMSLCSLDRVKGLHEGPHDLP